MRRYISLVLIVFFSIWILPLGEFIKPEKEQEACAGKRAVCLCTHLVAKQKAKTAGIKFVQSASNVNNQKNNSSSASYDLFVKKFRIRAHQQVSALIAQSNCLYSFLFTKPIEHVPKV